MIRILQFIFFLLSTKNGELLRSSPQNRQDLRFFYRTEPFGSVSEKRASDIMHMEHMHIRNISDIVIAFFIRHSPFKEKFSTV